MPKTSAPSFPMRSLALGVALSLAGVGLATWNAWEGYRGIEQVATTDIQLTRLGGEIMRLDEVLTMSARLAASTSDLGWEARYRQWEPTLDQYIKASMKLDPALGAESTAATDLANQRLVEMENRSFELVRKGESTAALALLFSDDYQREKKIYADGNDRTMKGVQERIDARLRDRSQSARWSFAISVALGLWMVVSWSRVIRLVREHLSARALAEQLAESAKQEAQAANNAKSEFLANMSHELRTPLNGVLGCVELLGSTRLDSEQDHYVTTVRDSGQNLLALLDDILDISKIEAGKLEIAPIPMDLSTIVAEVGEMLTLRARGKPVEIVTRYAPDAPKRIVSDPVRVRQIITNLASNALKFTAKGQIVVEVECKSRDAVRATLAISVTDSGIGIPADKQALIFEKFTQADASTTRKYGGTGLGLAISRQLAKMLEGKLEVTSEMGKGSRFTFEAPFAIAWDRSPQVSSDLQAPVLSLTGTSILVAEDNAVNLLVASKMLEQLGCKVESARTGVEALERARSGGYDLIFMDCQMPEMDGFLATAKIREHEAGGARVPIVALTAHAMRGDQERCLAAGMDDYLCKPMKRSDLQRVMSRWIAPRA
jgi:signal transduction histidine kinase